MKNLKLIILILTAIAALFACKKDVAEKAVTRLKSITSPGGSVTVKTAYFYNADGKLKQTKQYIDGVIDVFTDYQYKGGNITMAKTFREIQGAAPRVVAETEFTHSGGRLTRVEIIYINELSVTSAGSVYNFQYPDGDLPTVNITFPTGSILPSPYDDRWRSTDYVPSGFVDVDATEHTEPILMDGFEFDDKANPLYGIPALSTSRFKLAGENYFSVSFNPHAFFFRNNITKQSFGDSEQGTGQYVYNDLDMPASSIWTTSTPFSVKFEAVYEYGH